MTTDDRSLLTEDNDPEIYITWRGEAEDSGLFDPENAVTRWSGRVGVFVEDEDADKYDEDLFDDEGFLEIGRITLSVVDGAEFNHWLYVLSSDSDLNEFADIFVKEGLAKEIQQRFEPLELTPPGARILFLHSLKIIEAFRGREIGLYVIERALERFGAGCDFALLSAAPIERHPEAGPGDAFTQALKLRTFQSQEDPVSRKGADCLRAYYARAGFEAIEGTDYMLIPLGW